MYWIELNLISTNNIMGDWMNPRMYPEQFYDERIIFPGTKIIFTRTGNLKSR